MEFIAFVVAGLIGLWLIKAFMAAIDGSSKQTEKTTIRKEPLLGKIRGNGEFDQEVVGESNYQNAIDHAVSCTGKKHGPWETEAVLRLEDDNPYDEQAVAVHIGPKVVGYLSKKDARRYRKMLESNNLAAGNYIVDAKIFGGGEKSYGVWLDIEIA
ncbi:MAG: hypothetical protein PHD19_09480 [Dechloromonas sp.]|nr:hypothetical protein [Dechloromonas sp.]